MKRLLRAATGFAVSAALAMACDSKATQPTLVNDNPAQNSPTGPDGSTLKVTAPVPISPINDAVVADTPTLVAAGVSGKYGTTAVQYEFELYNDANVRVQSNVSATPSLAVAINLDFDKRYTWRVRGAIPAQSLFGPWSAVASFKSPAGGYIHAQEIFDPLTNGKTVGKAVGTTFTPDGIRLTDQHSYVEYVLPATLPEGEFSAILTNIGNGTEEWKTKVMSMLAGDGVNITDNTWRMTVDKRTAWVGQGSPARYTFCSPGPTCAEPNSGPRNWDRTHIYFWQFTWRGLKSRLVVLDGGTNGSPMVDISAGYQKVYNPNPHVVRLGSVGGRSGDETNPGTTIRNVWVSASARPNFKGDQK